MKHKTITELINQLKNKAIPFDDGLTAGEIQRVQAEFNFIFPPDLATLLTTALPSGKGFVNWRAALSSASEKDSILSRMNWPLEGMLFDIKNNAFWYKAWGIKPSSYKKQCDVATQHFKTYPTLIPIYSHRYIPSTPNEEGNPVLSVYQMDIIYYGYDLANYLANEFKISLPENVKRLNKPLRTIPFWSEWTD